MRIASFDTVLFILAVVAVAVCLFLPMLLVFRYESLSGVETHAGEVTVGIAVILRATARRLLRTGASNILRTTFGAYSRASARMVTRRLVRVALKFLAGITVKEAMELAEDQPVETEAKQLPPERPWLQIALGYTALCLSFWGVLAISPAASRQAVLADGALTPSQASLLAGLPILLYAGLNVAASRRLHIRLNASTAVDGLLLQAYFTGSGSFLPMTTDFNYEGDGRQKMHLAIISLGGLFVVHLMLAAWASSQGSYAAEFLGAMFLVYCFVYSFPIPPLEGYDVWAESKILWVCMWVPILLAFIINLPDSFGEIL